MKAKLILIVLLALCLWVTETFPQNHNIKQRKFILSGTDSTELKSTEGTFRGPDTYFIGYQWCNEPSAASAIQSNHNSIKTEFLFDWQTNQIPDLNAAQNGAYLLVSDCRFWSGILNDTTLCHSHSMTWEPNLKVLTTNKQREIIANRKGDPTRPIFGFQEINPLAIIPMDTLDSNYSFLKINDTLLIDSIIFANPWGSEYLYRSDYYGMVIDTSKKSQKNFQGYNFCVSVNLKRLGDKYSDTIPDDADVLEIKLPYLLNDTVTTGYITFDGLPTDTIDSIKTAYEEYRGLKTRIYYPNDSTSRFLIKLNMLPADLSAITVTARFRCWGSEGTDKFRNPRLSTPSAKYDPDIKKLGISAIYKGGCPLAIDYIRICSPHTLQVLEGQWDTAFARIIQEDINKVATYNTATGKDVKIHRFNSVTEGSVQNFDIDRYVTRLIGDVFATTTHPVLTVLYDYYVQPPNRVLNCGFVGTSINAPYIEKGERRLNYRYRTMGLIAGSTQGTYTDILTLEQQLNSGYETYYPFTSDEDRALGSHYSYIHFSPDSLAMHPKRIFELSWPDGEDSQTRAFQAFHQFQVWNLFYNEKVTGFQYCDKPWYFQTQNLIEWETFKRTVKKESIDWTKVSTNDPLLDLSWVGADEVELTATQMNSFMRPFTAEEARVIAYSAVGHGCKGLVIDGLSYYEDETYTRYAHRKALLADPLEASDDPYEYLMRDNFGGDFFDYATEKETISDLQFGKFSNIFLNFITLADDKETLTMNNMGCHSNRIYAGRKSVRTELYKIHRLLLDNNTAIKSLSLQAAYGKGIIQSYNQHPRFPLENPDDTLLDKYVRLRNITTRKIFQPHTNLLDSIYTTVPYSTVESKQDQYFDLSLFKYGQDSLINHMVLAIQNRRTDPLRLRYTGVSLNPRYLYFYTSAEMDDFSDHGGIDPLTDSYQTSADWRKIYRKSLGYREISLPIRRLKSTPPPYNIICDTWGYLVKDLTYKYPEDLGSMKYWMKDAYDHQINQFVACTYSKIPIYDTVNVKLRPGEAKFLDIKSYYQPKSISPVSFKFTPFPPPPVPPVLDTCDLLTHGMELYFKKCDSSDANNCLYEIYYINKSDSMNFYVPISAEFITENKLDTTYNIPSGFQYINIKKHGKFQSIWLPDSILSDTTYLGTFKANCINSQVIYKLGTRDCYSTEIVDLRCGICTCCDSVEVGVRPIYPQTFCRVFPWAYHRISLETGENCKYYGLIVRGGFSESNNPLLDDLCITPDSLNPQPIDFSTYNRSIEDPFMNIYCNGICHYCLKFTFTNIYGDSVCSKDYCITINNSQVPINILPSGIMSNQCFSIQPAKQNIPTEELHYDQKIIVDPNPTTGKANVKLNLENDLVGRLVLYTSTGELIKEIYNGKLPSGTSDYQIDLSSQPSGMYIITIESDGMQYIKKFVKE
ncbi:MAG: T9SS type A sorting domain-containing protein [bacterium]